MEVTPTTPSRVRFSDCYDPGQQATSRARIKGQCEAASLYREFW